VDVLGVMREWWAGSARRLEGRLAGLTDGEYFWELGRPCWSVRRDPAAPSGWQIDYDFPPPDPPPVTTIAWRLVHLANGNWIRAEHAFGPGLRMFPDLEVPGTAGTAVEHWIASRRQVESVLASDPDLDEPRPTPLGGPIPIGETLRILLDEQVHHGAEIGVLRDLYRLRSARAVPDDGPKPRPLF